MWHELEVLLIFLPASSGLPVFVVTHTLALPNRESLAWLARWAVLRRGAPSGTFWEPARVPAHQAGLVPESQEAEPGASLGAASAAAGRSVAAPAQCTPAGEQVWHSTSSRHCSTPGQPLPSCSVRPTLLSASGSARGACAHLF